MIFIITSPLLWWWFWWRRFRLVHPRDMIALRHVLWVLSRVLSGIILWWCHSLVSFSLPPIRYMHNWNGRGSIAQGNCETVSYKWNQRANILNNKLESVHLLALTYNSFSGQVHFRSTGLDPELLFVRLVKEAPNRVFHEDDLKQGMVALPGQLVLHLQKLSKVTNFLLLSIFG